jgi:hypothetical protein
MNRTRLRTLAAVFLMLALPAAAQEIPEAARREGVTREELPRWEELRRAPAPQPVLPTPLVSIDWPTITIPPAEDSCPNRGFEANNFGTWHALAGSRLNSSGVLMLGASPHVCTNLTTTSRHCIVPGTTWAPTPFNSPPGVPPLINLPFPNGGARSARIGNPTTGAQGEALYQVFDVTPATADLVYRYAVVLQDPGHVASAQPFYGVYVYDVTTSNPSPPLVAFKQRVASATDPFFNSQFGTQWRQVSCDRIDLTPWLNRRVMVVYASADCAYGGHYGYSYIDGKCGSPDPPKLTIKRTFCQGETVLATGSTTDPATSHTWTVVETDAGGLNPVAATQATETFNGPLPTTPRDLTAWYAGKGQQFVCGRHYKVTLTVTTECQTNQSVSQVILISCPPGPVISGPIDTCSNGRYCVQPRRGETYSWSVTNGTPATASGSCINVTWGPNGPYTITVTATNILGCKSTTKITIQPCRCCREVRLTNPSPPRITGGSNGLVTFSAPISLVNFSPVTTVTATLISATTSPSSSACGAAGPVLATIPSGSTVSGWSGPLLNGIPTSEISWTHGGATITNLAFPFQIQFPPAPAPPCSEIIRFCVKWTFTGPVGPAGTICRTCSFTRCYAIKRSGNVVTWLSDAPVENESPPPVD